MFPLRSTLYWQDFQARRLFCCRTQGSSKQGLALISFSGACRAPCRHISRMP